MAEVCIKGVWQPIRPAMQTRVNLPKIRQSVGNSGAVSRWRKSRANKIKAGFVPTTGGSVLARASR